MYDTVYISDILAFTPPVVNMLYNTPRISLNSMLYNT
jgi:hypothetical protein